MTVLAPSKASSFAPSRATTPAWVVSLALLSMLYLAMWPHPSQAEQPQSITFAFQPDTTVTWKKMLSDEQISDFKGAAAGRHQITDSEIHQRYVRDAEGEWEMIQLVRRIEMHIDGVRAENPMAEIILDHEIRLQLDEHGRATGATGFRELMRRYERELDPAIYARVRQAMTAESLARGEVTKRNACLGLVAGRTVSLGDRWGILDRVFMQGTWLPVSGVLHFESWTDLEGQPAIKIVYRFDASGKLYEAASASISEEISLRPEDWDDTPNNLGVYGHYTWVVDPHSGQPLYEGFEQVVTVPVGVVLEGERGELRSSHTWRWSKVAETAD